MAIIVLAALGGAIGYNVVVEGRWYAVALGAIIGMVIATFVIGLLVMLRPQPVRLITLRNTVKKYKRLRMCFRSLGVSYVLCFVSFIRWIYFHPIRDDERVVFILAAWFCCYCGLHYFRRVLDLWHCPKCTKLFGWKGVFTALPHVCEHCDFTVYHNDALTLHQLETPSSSQLQVDDHSFASEMD